jgi:hypothetical protein
MASFMPSRQNRWVRTSGLRQHSPTPVGVSAGRTTVTIGSPALIPL